MRHIIERVRERLRTTFVEKVLHGGHEVAHMSYLALVSVESHGMYGKAALVLLIIAMLMHFIGVGGEE